MATHSKHTSPSNLHDLQGDTSTDKRADLRQDTVEKSPTAVYRSLKERLITGELKAGEKLRPDDLKGRYGLSASAIREILLRLTHSNLLQQHEQRGFQVPKASIQLLDELMSLRILLECEGAKQSIEHGDIEWEARLNAAHHKLAHLETKMRSAADPAEFIPIWTRFDWEFHETLLSACPSATLRQSYQNTYERFRQQVAAVIDMAGFRKTTLAEHEAILRGAIERDANACQQAIHSHVRTFQAELELLMVA